MSIQTLQDEVRRSCFKQQVLLESDIFRRLAEHYNFKSFMIHKALGGEGICSCDSVERAVSKLRKKMADELINGLTNNINKLPTPSDFDIGPIPPTPEFISEDFKSINTKKVSTLNWRDLAHAADTMRKVAAQASWSQDKGKVGNADFTRPITLVGFCDAHWGSYGTDHGLLERFTDDILAIPDLYLLVLGDLEHMAIKLRGVMEVMDNVLPPKLQHEFTESWLEEIGHRILAACWDNHSVMREEDGSGSSQYAKIMSRKVQWYNGIGHLDVIVGKEVYKVALSHFFRGRSEHNPCHGGQKYMRFQGQDRELAMAGDSHVPGMIKYVDGDRTRVVVNGGSFQVNSGYAKRFFTLKTHPIFPCVMLFPDQHEMIPFWSIENMLRFRGDLPERKVL